MNNSSDTFITSLDEKELTNLLMVLQEIKDGLSKNKSTADTVRLRPYTRSSNPQGNKYFDAIVKYETWYDEEEGHNETTYDNDAFENSRNRFLAWLSSQGLIQNMSIVKRLEADYAQTGRDYEVTDYYELQVDVQELDNLLDKLILVSKDTLKTNAVRLSFTKITVPTLEIDDIKYQLKTGMQLRLPYYIISHCLEDCPNKDINLDELKVAMKAKGITTEGMTNLEQTFKNTVFGKGKLLDAFVDVYAHGIQVRDVAYITENKAAEVRAASTKT